MEDLYFVCEIRKTDYHFTIVSFFHEIYYAKKHNYFLLHHKRLLFSWNRCNFKIVMLKVNLTNILCQRTLHLESNKNFLWKNTFQRIIETSFLVSKESKNDSFHHRRLLRDQLKKLTRVSLLEAQKDNFQRYSFLGFTHISYSI